MPKATQPAAPKQEQQTPMQFDVRIYPVKTDGALKANASVNINGFFAVTNVRILDGSKGTFVSLPQYKGRNGEYKDICFPCTKESRIEFDKAVLGKYQHQLSQLQSQRQEAAPFPEQAQGMSAPTM